ncbi:MAG: hypothetical protein ACLS2V_12880 [Clostridium paraputrificum]|nr:hypothetical protein [Clostridium sp.]
MIVLCFNQRVKIIDKNNVIVSERTEDSSLSLIEDLVRENKEKK